MKVVGGMGRYDPGAITSDKIYCYPWTAKGDCGLLNLVIGENCVEAAVSATLETSVQ